MGTGRLKALGQISNCYEAGESDFGPHLRGEVRDRRGSRKIKINFFFFVFFSLEEISKCRC